MNGLKWAGWTAGLAAAAAAVTGAAVLGLRHEFQAPGPAPQALRVAVEPGLTLRGVLGRLSAAGALAHPRLAEIYLRLRGLPSSIKAGEYEIPAHASAAAVVALLESGHVLLDQITVVEGTRFRDFLQRLETDPSVRATLRGKSDAQVMAAIGRPGEQPEGRFFPDTYEFAAGTPDIEILEMAYDKMSRVLAAAWPGRLAGLPYSRPYQALILASMVEKETARPSERPLIAGVFVSRLRQGMRLQSDPTVIYGMGSMYHGNISSRDLTADTPYNTYTREGLPPTPICLPGRASILAAMHPQVTGALYFVASGDGDGSHRFSATLQEHDADVKHYLSRLRAEGRLPAHGAQRARAPERSR